MPKKKKESFRQKLGILDWDLLFMDEAGVDCLPMMLAEGRQPSKKDIVWALRKINEPVQITPDVAEYLADVIAGERRPGSESILAPGDPRIQKRRKKAYRSAWDRLDLRTTFKGLKESGYFIRELFSSPKDEVLQILAKAMLLEVPLVQDSDAIRSNDFWVRYVENVLSKWDESPPDEKQKLEEKIQKTKNFIDQRLYLRNSR